MKRVFDVLILGAGPAGIFAAYELATSGQGLSILVVDKGKDIAGRRSHRQGDEGRGPDIMCGMGGAGTWSDGTLNLRPDVGGDLDVFTGDHAKSWDLVNYVDRLFLKHGAPDQVSTASEPDAQELTRRAACVGVDFIEISQRHIGSDNAPLVLGRFEQSLKQAGVELLMETEVTDLIVECNRCRGLVLADGRTLLGRHVLVAPGRIGGEWIGEVFARHGVGFCYGPLDIGVRVEVPAIVMDPVVCINRDPKFHIRSRTYDDFVRTFCTNPRGYVVTETYEGHVGVNGHCFIGKKSENTNFAFLNRITLTEPLENTTRYGKSIGKLATTIGGGRPIVQRMGDLLAGRRSTLSRIGRNRVKPTLEDATPGDICMALPYRLVTNIVEGLQKLNEVIPGVVLESTLLYATEIKFYSTVTGVDRTMQTSVRGLHAAGDGCGLSRDIVNAAATGVLAARGILQKGRQ